MRILSVLPNCFIFAKVSLRSCSSLDLLGLSFPISRVLSRTSSLSLSPSFTSISIFQSLHHSHPNLFSCLWNG
ncbi:hypothetical protein EUGRSUZ_K01419 [Eucalyptus grandis]|uniref:Uncharacterized protein n=2 Tax=Eucalyptus grandis TaxID=71139 RepID=A0ACC3ITC5_EUCGR|nr:hypothetical protein EUGRSUZ_K01419 [Eucalyptus grandis]